MNSRAIAVDKELRLFRSIKKRSGDRVKILTISAVMLSIACSEGQLRPGIPISKSNVASSSDDATGAPGGTTVDPATGEIKVGDTILAGYTPASGLEKAAPAFKTCVDPGAANNIDGTAGADELIGTADGDYIRGLDDNDVIKGMDGNDFLNGNMGDDFVNGNIGNDKVHGGMGNDEVRGGMGNDCVYGGGGNDMVFGDIGDDLMYGDFDELDPSLHGNDKMEGGEGNDEMQGMAGDDDMDGGSGNDLMSGGSGNDTMKGGSGDDFLMGGLGMDELDGGEGNDQIRGGAEADKLYGGPGDDFIYGGGGNDVLRGDQGSDIMNGAEGDDEYIITADSGTDAIEGDNMGTNTVTCESPNPVKIIEIDNDTIIAGDGFFVLLKGHLIGEVTANINCTKEP